MLNASERFLQYLRVERNASNYTLKSYREDLLALAEYLAQAAGGNTPLPGHITVLDLARIRGRHARGGLRQDHHRPKTGVA